MKYDSTTNIIVLGEQCAGKTLFINNYLYNKTKTKHLAPTIGVDYYKKAINYQDNNYLLKIWDTGNGLLYKNILEFYLRNSSIFIILSTEHNINFIKQIIDIIYTDNQINPSNILIIYNKKSNNDSFKFDESSVLNYCPSINNIYFHYINVMNNEEIQTIFNQLKFLIFTDFNKQSNTKSHKKLIPLNKSPRDKNKEYCNTCCTIC
jgi:GTPase SAR1 family protein